MKEQATFDGFTLDMWVDETGLHCQWHPRVPKRGELRAEDLPRYRKARDDLLRRFAEAKGIRILVVE